MQRMVQRLLEGEASVLALFASILGATVVVFDPGNRGVYGGVILKKCIGQNTSKLTTL